MRFFFFFSLSVLTALGYCPPSEQDQWQDQFFKCVRTMDAADTEGNDRLNYSEYKKFVRYFAMTLYTIPLFTSGVVPESFKDLFQALIEMSGAENENGYMEIDIYGSNIEDVGTWYQCKCELRRVVDSVFLERLTYFMNPFFLVRCPWWVQKDSLRSARFANKPSKVCAVFKIYSRGFTVISFLYCFSSTKYPQRWKAHSLMLHPKAQFR